jgi:hypothetical protein
LIKLLSEAVCEGDLKTPADPTALHGLSLFNAADVDTEDCRSPDS